MEKNERVKAEIRDMTKDLLLGVKMAKLIMDSEEGGHGDLLVQTMIDELKKLLPTQAIENATERCTTNTIDFGDAIRAVKAGHRIARRGWNGKHQFVEMAKNISYMNPDGRIHNPDHAAIGNAALAFVGTSGVQLGWLASQADMLANDWYVVDLPNRCGETAACAKE